MGAMQLTLLGTGNAAGLPLYGCDCELCTRARSNRELQRSACSALLECDGQSYLLDAGQLDIAERFPSGSLSGIFLTHFHPDHVQGLFHLRWGVGAGIPVYSPPDSNGCADLYKNPGILQFLPQSKFESFNLDTLKVTPLPLIHSKPTFGYLFEANGRCLAYLTDTKGLPPNTRDFLQTKHIDLMVLDCSFIPGSEEKNHNNVDDALSILDDIRPSKMVLTHIGHELDLWLNNFFATLPEEIQIGCDGQRLIP